MDHADGLDLDDPRLEPGLRRVRVAAAMLLGVALANVTIIFLSGCVGGIGLSPLLLRPLPNAAAWVGPAIVAGVVSVQLVFVLPALLVGVSAVQLLRLRGPIWGRTAAIALLVVSPLQWLSQVISVTYSIGCTVGVVIFGLSIAAAIVTLRALRHPDVLEAFDLILDHASAAAPR